MGRPSDYSDELAAKICERLAEGEPLKKICEGDGMPVRSTVYQWLKSNPGFLTMYQAAREEYADAEFDRLEELVNQDPSIDDRGRVDLGWVQNQRLKVDTKKWALARMHPKKYAERFELTGAEGAPLAPEVITPERLLEGARRMAFVLTAADHYVHEAQQRQRAPALLRLVHEASDGGGAE